ncbi:MAG: hypothetical protein HFF52_08700 [Lawsonibacter sp.]|nr:hypothetical protein [Lawsonibacter sp.]
MRLSKLHTRLLVYAVLAPVLLLAACQKQELLPKPEFPLSEEAVIAAVTAQGLDWTVSWNEQQGQTDTKTVYSLLQPESGREFGTVFITSSQTEELGRYLGAALVISRTQLQWPLEEPHSWEEWKDLFKLSARLYGGFEDEEEIYRACAKEELPLEETTLWEGALTGGYCRVKASAPIQDWSPFAGGGLTYNIHVDLFEREDAYHIFTQK